MAKRPRARVRVPKPAKSPAETRHIFAALAQQHPNADTELNFTTPYELLVATILSAQCTDERVNQVTPALFKRYPDARALARASTRDLEPQIQSTGFFRAKSRSLLGMASAVVERHAGQVPNTMEALVELPGVGRKTANVVLGHALGVPGLPVDRHVLRVTNRIGVARSDDPEIVEQQLAAALTPSDWTRASDTFILHGRRICKPRPLCDRCSVRDSCLFFLSGKAARISPRGANESAPTVAVRRAPEARGTGRGGEAPREAAESRLSPAARRAPEARGTGRGGGAPREAAESRLSPAVRRAPEARGTGRGGGAPRQTKK
jgi:endonuclease-3